MNGRRRRWYLPERRSWPHRGRSRVASGHTAGDNVLGVRRALAAAGVLAVLTLPRFAKFIESLSPRASLCAPHHVNVVMVEALGMGTVTLVYAVPVVHRPWTERRDLQLPRGLIFECTKVQRVRTPDVRRRISGRSRAQRLTSAYLSLSPSTASAFWI